MFLAGTGNSQMKHLKTITIILGGMVSALFILPVSANSAESAAQSSAITIGLIGDSTVASFYGWGPAFAERCDNRVSVFNYAQNGATLDSLSGKLDKLLEKKPDYVLIQFGHNDMKRYDSLAYGHKLTSYVKRIRKAGGKPVILSSVTRRNFDANGKIKPRYWEDDPTRSLPVFGKAAQQVAREFNLPFVDLYTLSLNHHNRIGPETSARYNYKPDDRTHFSKAGAKAIANLVATELGRVIPELADHMGCSATPRANASKQPVIQALWPNGAPMTEHLPDMEQVEERSKNPAKPNRKVYAVTKPTYRVYLPEQKSPDGCAAVIICPGGGYSGLAIDKEGHDVARFLNQSGIAGIVLKYRMPNVELTQKGLPLPLADAQRLIRIVRSKAEAWRIDPDRIGILGFSAGGHLAASAATHFDTGLPKSKDGVEHFSCRPDFAALIYPVVSMDSKVTHRGSRDNLLGKSPDPEMVKRYSNELQVTSQTPPVFMVHSKNDQIKHLNSELMREACNQAGIVNELVSYRTGGHGFGLGVNGGEVTSWPDRFVQWLGTVNMVKPNSRPGSRILCFGDSITAGGKWLEIVEGKNRVEMVNFGRGGRKAAEAKQHLSDFLNQHPDARFDKIIMFLGVNDLPARDPRSGDVKVAGCVKNMSDAIDVALTRFQPKEIILVAPCGVNADTMNAVNRSKGYHITAPMLAELEKGYRELAGKKGTQFISLLNTVSRANFKDGLHPDAAGDAEIAEAISSFLFAAEMAAKTEPAPKGWPGEVKTVRYRASSDDSIQPMLMYPAKSGDKRPLLVGLHTWSGTYQQAGGEAVYARWCIENDWHFIHPHFRGPNWTPNACGSDMAVQDIIDAVEYIKTKHAVDTDRIYLVGASGGGHASLLMAGRAPEIWAGVSAWVPISDLGVWWKQKSEMGSKYATHIEKAVGGKPDQDEAALRECVKRSPLTYLQHAAGVNLDINAGVTDGHKGGSVPFSHSLYAFNQVVPEADRIAPDFVETFYEKQALPEGGTKADADPLYGKKEAIFRKISGNTRVTIFQGKHEIIHQAALNWLAKQRKGTPANWNVTQAHDLKTDDSESESGK